MIALAGERPHLTEHSSPDTIEHSASICTQRTGVKTMVRRLITYALVAGTLVVAACNTVEGAGEDVKSAGNAIENTVD